MNIYLRKIGRDSLIYGLGGTVPRLISFILLPIFTRIFTPDDYGVIETVTILNGILITFIVMGMDSALSFYFFKLKDEKVSSRTELISSIMQWRISYGLGIILICSVLFPFISRSFFDMNIQNAIFYCAIAGNYESVFMQQGIEIFRLTHRPGLFISISILASILSASFALFFILYLKWGVLGFFAGSMISNGITLLLSLYLIRQYLDFSKWHVGWWSKLLKFSLPLMPSGFAIYILNSSDRWFINYFHGHEALGVYSIGGRFILIISFMVTAFRQAWWPIVMDEIKEIHGPQLVRNVAKYYMGLAVMGIVILTCMSKILVHFLVTPAFYACYPIIGVLAWQAVFYGFFLIASIGIWMKEKTYISTILMLIAAAINIVLDYFTVPVYGALGAAVTTAVSFLIWIISTLVASEKLYKINFPYKTLAFQVSVGIIGTSSIIYLIAHNNTGMTVLLTIAIILLLVMSIFSKEKRGLVS